MNKTGMRVDVARPVHDHDDYYDNGVPILNTVETVNGGVNVFMEKQIEAYTPTCRYCPEGGHEYRYDSHGDQVCEHCGDIRNQSPALSYHEDDRQQFNGFETGDN